MAKGQAEGLRTVMRKLGYSIIGTILASLMISGGQEKTDSSSFPQQEMKYFLHMAQEAEQPQELEKSEEPISLTKEFGLYNLTSYEWDIFGQVIMAEARGESFEVQYYIACTILNRVESDLFPNTIAGVIYQTIPTVQFYGAWDSNQYEVTDSVWEAIQTALWNKKAPEDMYYFTSEGYLEGTDPWKHIGNMWFSRQK